VARLSNRAVRFARRGLRALAWLPLRVLGGEDRARVLDRLTASAVTQVDIGGASLRFLTPSALLRSRALSLRLKEPDTLQWIDGFGADEVFWDVGANVGVFGLYAAKRRGVRVLAFEPSASNYMVLCRNIRLNALEERVARLSPREYEVMAQVVAGRLNKQIAADLGISEKTVKVHRGKVMEKMEAGSVAALVDLCRAAGIAAHDAQGLPR